MSDANKERIARNREEALRRMKARLEREAAAQNATTAPSTSTSTMTTNVRSSYGNFSSMPKSLQAKYLKENPNAATSTSTSHSNASSGTSAVSTTSNSVVNRNLPASLIASPPAVKQQPQPTFSPSTPARLPRSQIDVQFKCLSADRFVVKFYPFHSAVVAALKTLPSRFWDDKQRQWTVAFSEMKKTEAVLSALKEVEVTITPLPENVMRLLTVDGKTDAVPSDLSVIIDPTLVGKLFPYQRSGVNFGLHHRGRVLIADEMGLGKSIQALTIARYYKAEWPLMIICPSSVKSAWRNQLNTFLPVITRITVIEKGTDALPDARTSNTVVIMSYDQMVLKQKDLLDKQYQVIILDESHMLKDSKAKRTRVATDLAKRATRVILLSGTPALSRPAELFSQIRLVDDKLFPHFQNFAIRYCDGKQGRFCFEAKGCTNSEELSAILAKRVMIRRLKADVLKDLPDKRREVVYLSGDSIDSRMDSLQKAKQAFESQNGNSLGGKGAGSNESLLEYFNLTGIVKAAAVCNHILDNYFYPDAPKRKVLIFGHHQIVLDTIQVEVHKRNLRSIRIDGHTPSKDRGALTKSFQDDPDVVVAVLSMTAAGTGITLTAASVVVFAELNWNPGTLLQCEDRAHRVGQKDSVFVQYLVARNTADDVMWPLIQQKLAVLGQVNLSSDTFKDADHTHLNCNEQQDLGQCFKENAAKRPRID